MNRLLSLSLGASLLALSMQGQAVGLRADVQVVDRDNGRVLPTYYAQGQYWVAGTPGARYAIRIHSHARGRLLAVTAVDGVNVISGATASWDQTGYVFGPRETYDITGWRKSNAEIAAFLFADVGDSYASRTGRPDNVGIIGVALFEERVPEPPMVSNRLEQSTMADKALQQRAALPSDAPAGAADVATAAAPRPAPSLGTGHGARETSVVHNTDFERTSDSPVEVIRIRYDRYANLVAMGIIPRPHIEHSGPNPFPAAPLAQFVPDPPVPAQ